MELHPSFRYSSGSFPHSSGRFPRSSGSPSDAPPELSASGVLWTSLRPYWTLSEIKGTVLRWGAQRTSWGQSPSESVICTPPRDCMHPHATVFNRWWLHHDIESGTRLKEHLKMNMDQRSCGCNGISPTVNLLITPWYASSLLYW